MLCHVDPSMKTLWNPLGCWPFAVSPAPWTPSGVLALYGQSSPLDPHRGVGLSQSIQPPGPPQGCRPLTVNPAPWTPSGVLASHSQSSPLDPLRGVGLSQSNQPPGPPHGCRPHSQSSPLDPRRGVGLSQSIQPPGPPQGCWPYSQSSPLDPHRGVSRSQPVWWSLGQLQGFWLWPSQTVTLFTACIAQCSSKKDSALVALSSPCGHSSPIHREF